MLKKKKLNKKNEHVKKRLEENPAIEKKKFDDLLENMIEPQSKSNGTIKQ